MHYKCQWFLTNIVHEGHQIIHRGIMSPQSLSLGVNGSLMVVSTGVAGY